MNAYVGRFAPSPTGPLHAGSLVAALAGWLDARAHGGRWLLRIEDVDTPRTVPGSTDAIRRALRACGLHWDGEPLWQSARGDAYRAALDDLVARGLAYPCACTRKEIADSLLRAGDTPRRHGELPYPGTCRHGLLPGRAPRAWRLRVPSGTVSVDDRLAGRVTQDVEKEVGDFVLKRADGLWAYQLAVVVDDAAQGVTDVVRGADLLSSTPRQAVLQRLLGLPAPRWMHVPVVTAADGEKLSKQNGARPLSVDRPADALAALREAGRHLGLQATGDDVEGWLASATAAWSRRFGISRA